MRTCFPCPCCGYRTFDTPPGSYDICPVCFWEDDQVQLRWPEWSTGANRLSLVDAQATYAEIGASEPRLRVHVRAPRPDESREPEWRPVDPTIDDLEPAEVAAGPWPTDLTTLYWWRPTYVRSRQGASQ